MTKFNDTVRIFGDELDEADTYIDATIEGYSLDGNVKLVEDVDIDPREWVVSEASLKTLKRKDLLLGHSEMPDLNHEVWDVVGKLQGFTTDEALGAAQGEIKEMARQLFNESVKAQRSQGSS